MKSTRSTVYKATLAIALIGLSAVEVRAQSPSEIYTWAGTGNIRQWFRSFGAASTSETFANTIAGELTITETSAALGGSQAFSDDFNRVRESPTAPSGGLDLTGLSALQFDFGYAGSGSINVQFYVQATTASTFLSLGPDLTITPGINTYTVPLTGLTADQAVYVRTIGINVRDHSGLGNVTWTLQSVRSVGPALTQRTLASFDNGTAEGGLQGAIVNFDGGSVVGNAGQNQSGLIHNAAGSGSLQWIDAAGGAGGAISLGNGTAWNGNTFNNRTTDLSNYGRMVVRMKATETATADGGSVNVQAFFQNNNFGAFLVPGTDALPIDGQYHDLDFFLEGLANMNVVDQTGINLGSHPDELQIDVDSIVFSVPEPCSGLLLLGFGGLGLLVRRGKRS